MTLHKVNHAVCRSDDGREIIFKGHNFTLEYREDGRVLKFNLGFGSGDSWVLEVDSGSFWEPPFGTSN